MFSVTEATKAEMPSGKLNSASFSALNVSPVNAEGEGAGNQLRKRFGYDVGVEASWAWLEKTMEEARKKGQNVSLKYIVNFINAP